MRALALLLLVTTGCGRAWAPTDGPADGIFPHTEAFVADHKAEARDPSRCFSCHAIADGGLVLGAPPAAPSCNSCHVHPHAPEFAAGAQHGAAWLETRGVCQDCHGTGGAEAPRGQVEGTCTGCHASYPHTGSWAEPENHGASVTAHGGPAACLGCHKDSGAATPCAECHAAYPHTDDWADPTQHGAAYRSSEDVAATCGVTCHDRPAERGGTSCARCHDVFPHEPSWPAAHPAIAQARGAVACEGCHANGLGTGDNAPPMLPVPCATACHQETP